MELSGNWMLVVDTAVVLALLARIVGTQAAPRPVVVRTTRRQRVVASARQC